MVSGIQYLSSTIKNQGRPIELVILPCLCQIIQYEPIKMKEAGVGGGGDSADGINYCNLLLAIFSSNHNQ